MDNLQKLRIAFSTALGMSEDEITDELGYDTNKKWDSIAHMTLVAEIENTFDIMLDTDSVIDMSSFAKAKEIVGKYGVEINI